VFDDINCNVPEIFNLSSFLRIKASATDVRIFTGLSDLSYDDGISDDDLFHLLPLLDHGFLERGSAVFYASGDLPESLFSKRKLYDRLCSRRWKEATSSPLILDVFIDYLPSNLRITICDQVALDDEAAVDGGYPFNVQLQLSQLCAVFSFWYGNMQELPMLFPYSVRALSDAIEIPPCPADWPEYGTDSYVTRMSSDVDKNLQIILSLSSISWRCSFDRPDFYSRDIGCRFMLSSDTDALCIKADNFSLQIDFRIDNVMKVGFQCLGFSICDYRMDSDILQHCFTVPHGRCSNLNAMDMNWGLSKSIASHSDVLNNPMQVNLYISPDRNCLVNVGISHLDSCSTDLGFFWILLEYFTCYFMQSDYGNPYFAAEAMRKDFLKHSGILKDGSRSRMMCLNWDVRLRLDMPSVTIPCNSNSSTYPLLVVKSQNGGIFYRYRTIDYALLSQSIVTTNVDVLFLKKTDISHTITRNLKNQDRGVHFLSTGMSICLIHDTYIDSKHINLSFFSFSQEQQKENVDGIEIPLTHVKPLVLPPCTVCNPAFHCHSQAKTSSVCDIFVAPEYLKDAGDLFTNFVGPYPNSGEQQPKRNESSFSINAHFDSLRFVVCDPVLGMHLPLANIYVSELTSSISDMKMEGGMRQDKFDFQFSTDFYLWIDYYKSGPTRSWEPLVEPFKCTVLFEKSSTRGQGITLCSDCPLHFNITGALLETMCFATSSLYDSFFNILRSKKAFREDKMNLRKKLSPSNASRESKKVQEFLCYDEGIYFAVDHEKVHTVSPQDRVAFSLLNLSGSHLRFHQRRKEDGDLSVGYIDHLAMTSLSFPPTRSVFKNLKIILLVFFFVFILGNFYSFLSL
jgi:hypothetical protein